jgi:beta-mannanase
LSAIANGAWDEYISQWAAAAAAWGKPFFLRFDHEMNGWWYPWSEQVNGNKPGEFVAAWRHVHDIFVQQGATNATWVWCPNVVGRWSTPMASMYPGDDYIDWACMDGYNWGFDRDNAWQSFGEVFSGGHPSYGPFDTYQELRSIAPAKPVMIGEIASSERGGSKAEWIRDMLQVQLPLNYPDVKAVVWFNPDGGDPTLSWAINSSNDALQAFKRGISSRAYAGNAYSTLDVSPIPPAEVLVPRP